MSAADTNLSNEEIEQKAEEYVPSDKEMVGYLAIIAEKIRGILLDAQDFQRV